MAVSVADLDGFRTYLYRYALLQLRDPEAAADAVQDTLLAAVDKLDGFASQSSLRTWLTAILKHKITDQIRARCRSPQASDEGLNEFSESDFDGLFDARLHWAAGSRPRVWDHPEAALENSQFWAMFEACCARMPQRNAQIFMLREVMGLALEEICKDFGISATNASVLLYRARMALRECLEQRWFQT